MDIKTSNNNNILSEILPSFGGTASFSSTSETINFGDNHKQSMISHINGLSMSLSLNFEDITQNQAHDLIAFLQSRYYYEPQVYSNEGKFTNKRIEPFDYLPSIHINQINFIVMDLLIIKIIIMFILFQLI